MGAVDLPVHAYLASCNVTTNWPPVQRSVQIGRHVQQYETSDVFARRYMEVDRQPLAAKSSHRRGQWTSGFAHFEAARGNANS